MAQPTAWTESTPTATGWSNSHYIVNLGVIMNDTGYLLNDTVATLNDEKLSPNFAGATGWTEEAV